MQFRESDWAFVCRLLEEEGFFYFFEHKLAGNKREHLLHIGDDYQHHLDIPGDGTVPFHVADARVPAKEYISRFFFSEAVQSDKVTLDDYDFKKPNLDLSASRSGEQDKLEVYEYPGDYQTPEKGKELARVRLEELDATRQLGEGQSTCPRLVGGHCFMLDRHERSELNKKRYLLTRVHHSAEPHQGEGVGGGVLERSIEYGNEFHCIPRDVPYRPARLTPRPRITGVQTAVVQATTGEIETDEHGQVHVRFHWDRRSGSKKQLTCWIRVAQTWAGPAFGAMYVPRAGHEVIVEFIDGDPDRPIITGRVYNGLNVPPYPLPKDQTISTLMSQSSPEGGGFNEVRFEDKKGEEEFFTHAQKDQNEIVKANQNTSVGGERTLAVGADHVEEVGGESAHRVTGDRTVKTDASYQLDAAASIKAKAGSNVTLKAGGYLLAQAGGAAALVGAKALVKGSSGGVEINGSPSVKVEGSSTAVVSAPKAVLNAGTAGVIGSDLVWIRGAKIVLEAGQIILKGGLVDIMGTPVLINCGGGGASASGSVESVGAPAGEDPSGGAAGAGAKDRGGRNKKPGGGGEVPPGGVEPPGGKIPPGGVEPPGGEIPPGGVEPPGKKPPKSKEKKTASLMVWVGWQGAPQGAASGAEVSLSGASSATATTDGTGFANFSGLAAGEYTVKASGTRPSGVVGQGTAAVTLAEGEAAKAAVMLEEKKATVMLDVSWKDTGDPVQGAAVKLTGPSEIEGTTDAKGEATFNGVSMGQYSMTITAKLRSDPTRTTTLEHSLDVDSENVVVSVGLEDSARQKAKLMIGVFKDGDPKRPCVGALVTLYNTDTKEPAGAWNTPASGWITGINTDAGFYSIKGTTPDDANYGDAAASARLTAGKEHRVPLAVYRQGQTTVAGKLTVMTLNADGTKADGVRVYLRKGGGPVVAAGNTDNGSITFVLAAGWYGVHCDFFPRFQEVEVQNGQRSSATFKSKPDKPSNVPWTQYFDTAYVGASTRVNVEKSSPLIKIFKEKHSRRCLRYMREEVYPIVAANHPGEEKYTDPNLHIWYNANKEKVDILDAPTPGGPIPIPWDKIFGDDEEEDE